MNTGKIIEELERQFPPHLAEDWDNSGLQVGRRTTEVKKVMVTLDATEEAVQKCVQEQVDLLVTHHPLMLASLRQINEDSMYGRKILTMAEHRITHYAMHTNYDVARMAALADGTMKLLNSVPLEVTGTDENGEEIGVGTVGTLPEPMSVEACCEYVKRIFALEHVQLFGDRKRVVSRVALCPGSGSSLLKDALKKNAELYITGDFGHHDGLDAMDQGLAVIDAGHYGIEHIFIDDVAKLLCEKFSGVEVITMEQPPFEIL